MKEEYKAVFDELTPDDALLDLKKPRRRMLRPALALLLALVLTGGILLHETRKPATQPQNRETGVSDTISRQPRMVLIAGAETLPVGEEEAETAPLSAPLNYRLHCFDLKGLSEDERQALIDEKRAEFDVLVPEPLPDEEVDEKHFSVEIREDVSDAPDYILPFATEMLFEDVYVVIEASDAFTIRVPEATELLEVTANCENGAFLWVETHADQGNFKGTLRGCTNLTEFAQNGDDTIDTAEVRTYDENGNEITTNNENGWSVSSKTSTYDEYGNEVVERDESAVFSNGNRKMTVEGSFYQAASTGYVKVLWFPTKALVKALAEKGADGTFDLTGMRDTITFTAQFNDGTTETCVTALSFSADGQMNVTVR